MSELGACVSGETAALPFLPNEIVQMIIEWAVLLSDDAKQRLKLYHLSSYYYELLKRRAFVQRFWLYKLPREYHRSIRYMFAHRLRLLPFQYQLLCSPVLVYGYLMHKYTIAPFNNCCTVYFCPLPGSLPRWIEYEVNRYGRPYNWQYVAKPT